MKTPRFDIVATMATLAIVSAIAAVTCADPVESPPTAPKHPYRDLVHKGEYDKAEPIIRAMLGRTRRDDPDRWQIVVDLAAVQRISGQAKAALKTLDSLAPADRDRPKAALELARGHAAAGQVDSATGLIRLLQSNPAIEIRCFANFEAAKLDFDAQRYEACIKLCEQVIKEGSKIDLYQHPDERAIRELLVEARKLLAEAKDRLIAFRYGEDYALYRKARIAQARGEYAKAIDLYRQIKAPILSDAAGCYIPACVVAMDNVADAAQLYQRFIDANPFGLYRGEALYELGRLRLLHARSRGDLNAAHATLKRAVEWHQQILEHANAANIEPLKSILKDFPIPEQHATGDRMGNSYRVHAGPETIVNRLTCKWYLPHIKAQTQLLYAFTLTESGKIPEAVAVLEEIERTASLNGKSLLNHDDMPQRLRHDAADGAFLLPSDAWQSFSAEYAVPLRLGFYLHVAGEHSQAKTLFSSVQAAVAGKAAFLNEQAAAQIGLACVDFINGQDQQAVNRLDTFTTTFRNSGFAPLGQFIQANILSGRPDGYQSAIAKYTEVAAKYARSDYAPRALLALAVCAANHGDITLAQDAISRLRGTYGGTTYANAARTVAGLINDKPGSSSESGRVIDYSRTIVIPGGADLTFNFWDLAPTDIMSYRVGWTLRSGCGIKNFRLRLTVMEPQVTGVNNPPLQFIRVPLLFRAP